MKRIIKLLQGGVIPLCLFMFAPLRGDARTDALADLTLKLPSIVANGISITVEGTKIFSSVQNQIMSVAPDVKELFELLSATGEAIRLKDLGKMQLAPIGDDLNKVIPEIFSIIHLLTPIIRRTLMTLEPFANVLATNKNAKLLSAGKQTLDQAHHALVLVNRIDGIIEKLLPRITKSLAGLDAILAMEKKPTESGVKA